MKVRPKDFIRGLYQNLPKASDHTATLKVNADLQVILKVIHALPAYPHPLTQYFFGSPWQQDVTGLFQKRTQQFSSSLLVELQWTVATIAYFSKELNAFLTFRQNCECEFLRGEFANAENIRVDIEKRFGVSLWSLQQKFLLLEYTQGLESNTKHLSELNSLKSLHFFVQVLINFLSMRAERQLSYENYQYKLAKYLSTYNTHPQLKSFFEHVIGREGVDLHNEDLVLYLLSDGALIDRCLYAISLLQRLP